MDSQEFQKPQFLYASFRVSNIWQTKLLHGTSIERTLPEKHPHLKLPIESGDVRAAVARTYKSSALKGRPMVAFFISPLNGIQETPQKWPSKRIWPFGTGPTWRADVLWGSDTGSVIGFLKGILQQLMLRNLLLMLFFFSNVSFYFCFCISGSFRESWSQKVSFDIQMSENSCFMTRQSHKTIVLWNIKNSGIHLQNPSSRKTSWRKKMVSRHLSDLWAFQNSMSFVVNNGTSFSEESDCQDDFLRHI